MPRPASYPAKPGLKPAEPHPSLLPPQAVDAVERFKVGVKPPAEPGKVVLDDEACRALRLEGAAARILQAILDRPGVTAKQLAEAAQVTPTAVYGHVASLMDAGYVEVRLLRVPGGGKRGLTRAHHANVDGMRAACLDAISNLRSVLQSLGGSL